MVDLSGDLIMLAFLAIQARELHPLAADGAQAPAGARLRTWQLADCAMLLLYIM